MNRLIIVVIGACMVLLLSSGCGTASNASAPRGLAQPSERNYVREGERVSLHLITWTDWKNNYDGLGIKLPPQKTEIVEEDQPASEDRTGFIGEAVGSLVGIAIDVVKKEIEKEAARHVQQYTQSAYSDGFWEKVGVPRYAAFELIRTADGYPNDRPAFRFIAALVPSEYDRRLIVVQPVYIHMNAAAAKVSPRSRGSRTVTIEVNVIVQGATISKEEKFVVENLADISYKWSGYGLNTPQTLGATWSTEGDTSEWSGSLADQAAGYFMAPMPSASTPKNWVKKGQGGAFRLFVAVTERDDSGVQQSLLEFAEFVGSKREYLIGEAVKAVDQRDGPPPPG